MLQPRDYGVCNMKLHTVFPMADYHLLHHSVCKVLSISCCIVKRWFSCIG